MIRGMWNGFSGINTFDRAISAESNNSTNTNTPGYKSTDVRFEDMMYQSGQVGTGTQIEGIYKRFHQGDIRNTGHTYDVGIEGPGYFMLTEPSTGERFYSRAGNFQMGSDGLLQTPDGLHVQGLTPQAPTVITTNNNYTQLSKIHERFVASETIGNANFIQTINARVSDYTKTAEASGTSGEGLKSKSAKIADVEALMADYKDKLSLYRTTSTAASTPSTNQITSLDFTSYINELNDPNDFIKINIDNFEIRQQFDTSVDKTMRLFADKISEIKGMKGTVDTTLGRVTVESMVPAKEVQIYDAAVNDKAASVNQVQNQSLGTGYGVVESSRTALQAAIQAAGGEFIEITSSIPLANQANLQVNNINMKLADLNLSEFTFGTVTIEEGVVYLSDSDNKFVVGKIQTAFFRNDQGLDAEGNNLYSATDEAGNPQYAGNINTLHSKSLEVSNTNNTETLTNLLTYQKAFEANSKSISTADELLRTAINLRK